MLFCACSFLPLVASESDTSLSFSRSVFVPFVAGSVAGHVCSLTLHAALLDSLFVSVPL